MSSSEKTKKEGRLVVKNRQNICKTLGECQGLGFLYKV